MEINTKDLVLTMIASAVVGIEAGVLGHSYYTKKHTPEDTIRKLEAATAEKKAAADKYSEEYYKYLDVYNKLASTKKAYQDEIRPEIESKIRKELEDYIGKADETYAKAKHENEMASLRLELIKQYKKEFSSAYPDGFKFNINI